MVTLEDIQVRNQTCFFFGSGGPGGVLYESVVFLWEENAVFESVYFSVGIAKVLLKGDIDFCVGW